MKVVVADAAGACYGVKRALELVEQASDRQSSVQTLGPLIHNPIVVAGLERKGVGVADSPKEVDAELVVIRSHGVTPEVLEQLEEGDAEVLDATCPHVLRAQKAAYDMAKHGLDILVVGEQEHPEVQGLCAWALKGGANVYTATAPCQLPDSIPSRIGVVVQTTQTRSVLERILEELDGRGVSAEVKDTICSSTAKRQRAALDLASRVDLMIVVGGRNSSNTTRLFEICAEAAPRALQIESPDELREVDFSGVKVVGVTAGASTPDSHIRAVVDCLRS